MDLKTMRVMKKKNQWDLTINTGIKQARISLIENEYVIPSSEEKRKISLALGVKLDEIDWPTEEK